MSVVECCNICFLSIDNNMNDMMKLMYKEPKSMKNSRINVEISVMHLYNDKQEVCDGKIQ